MADNQVDLKLNLDFKGVNDALYEMIGQFNGTDKEFQKIATNIQKNAKNLEASIKLFGPASQQAGAAANKLQKDFQSLVANGIDPASNSFKKMTASMPTSAGLNATTGSLRKNNMQWANLALVIQDLPFGFRGIQNNLPALAGGFAKMTGPVYLGISAIIAAVTAWDMGLFNLGKTTKKAKEDQDDYTKALNSSISSAYGEISQVKSLVSVVNNQTIAIDQRRLALKKLQDEYPGYFKNMSLEQTSVDGLALSVGELTKAMIARAEATAMTSEIEKIAAKRYENTKAIDKNEAAITNLRNSLVILSKESQYVSGGFGADAKKLASPYTLALGEIQKLEKANRGLISSNEALQNSMSLLQNSVDFRTGTSIGLQTNKPEPDKVMPKPTVSKFYEDLAQEEYNFYKDSIFRAEEYFTKLNNIQKINALMQATIRGASLDELFIIQQTYEQKELNFKKSIEDKKFAIRQQSEERQKQLTKFYDDEKLKNQYDYTKNYIATLDAQLKAEMRLNRNNVALQQEDIKNKLIQLQFAQVFAAGNVKALDAINAAILKLKGNLTGLGDVTTTVNNILTTGLQDAFVGIGESLGELVTTGKFSFGILGNILADALIGIGKALILYSSLVQAAKKAIEAGQVKAGLIIGIAAVAAGFALKGQLNKKRDTEGPKAFANGGIISGPTMGLMGEYPGASHNPEVVAPLDKLKSLIGGGGGTLEARISGNDLLILMNKAGRNNNNTF
jgi:hypothetical protein